jgi:hypothetical protein
MPAKGFPGIRKRARLASLSCFPPLRSFLQWPANLIAGVIHDVIPAGEEFAHMITAIAG